VKFVKLLIVPAMLLGSVALAAPASAHALTNATVNVACDTPTGRVCVTLAGTIEQGNAARNVFFQLFAKGSDTKLDEIEFQLPAFSDKGGNDFSKTLCFKAITGDVPGFDVKVVKVTDAVGNPSDLAIHITGGKTISFDKDHQPQTVVATTGKCAPPPQSPPAESPPAQSPPAQSPASTTTVTLAKTGGLDFRFPLIGLVLLVAGGTLFVVSASRGRSTGKK
jgi:hypothetical protein